MNVQRGHVARRDLDHVDKAEAAAGLEDAGAAAEEVELAGGLDIGGGGGHGRSIVRPPHRRN